MISYAYCIENCVNGKRYIGKANDPEKRFSQHLSAARLGEKSYLYEAIRKHGDESFTLIFLVKVDSESAAFDEEIRLIREYKTNNSSFGYNMNEGGIGGGIPIDSVRAKLRFPRSDSTKAKMRKPKSVDHRRKLSESKLGSKNPQFGKPLDDDHKSKIREAVTGDRNGFFGKSHTEETREKLRASFTPERRAAMAKRMREYNLRKLQEKLP